MPPRVRKPPAPKAPEAPVAPVASVAPVAPVAPEAAEPDDEDDLAPDGSTSDEEEEAVAAVTEPEPEPEPESDESGTEGDDPPRTSNIMTKFELTRVLCARAQQLSEGAPSTVPETRGMPPLRAALAELDARRLPMKIQRVLPDGSKEVWRTRDMELPERIMQHIRALDMN